MTQTNLFSWDALEARSDLDRLKLVRDHLPDAYSDESDRSFRRS